MAEILVEHLELPQSDPGRGDPPPPGQPFSAAAESPRLLYAERLRGAENQVQALRQRERSIGNARLMVFLAAIAVAWFAFDLAAIPRASLLLPVVLFAALVIHHGRVADRRERAERIAAHYAHGLARIDGTWHDLGQRGDRFAAAAHPYAGDLDIFGRGSLFQLLCTARSAAGQSTLAEWLSRGAEPDEVAARQGAVIELRGDVDRRERLAMIGAEVVTEIDPAYLAEWATRPLSAQLSAKRLAAAALVAASIATFVLQGMGVVPPLVFLIALAAQTAFGAYRRAENHAVCRSLELAPAELESLARLLEEVENSTFESPRLLALQTALASDGATASAQIAKLNRWIQLLDARRNILFAPVSILILWTTQISMVIEEWRRVNGPHLGAWLRAAGEYESLCALAAFAFEQPATCFAEVTASGGPRFAASGARHPLIPFDHCVANDITLDAACSLLVVSGSNMSGKSTLLRTIGTNAVLAQMGAPVCGDALRMSPLRIGTSMRTQDSLIDGTSRFYAEIKRLKLVVDLATGDRPLIFLLDEVLHGTNSHDRGIGAEAVVRNLLERGAIGLITTHDLTLAAVADNLAPRARNVHFADQLIDSEMVFDYKMHEGPVRKSNALGLMRAIGLQV